ncbi:5'/3'-nucleotidase SurE [Clostridiisalibacter paucivorans]|uniref:5'/3'-nucleotidase SurE n=1 Tax=Clostridiisalibacter paucivorans TaxID=408753 RepID=UPI00047EF625|nr:5'/3'-nucleotidase SurE [Clostridiisalibacter paucivorans]
MNILISNDDGINAIGIKLLAEELTKLGHVTVVAPDRERSATGHAITIHNPLRVEKIENYYKQINAWSVNGTPGDCVKIAVESILNQKPDLVVSGINNGPNLGSDVLYSGTVSAAMEGSIQGIPSIAISLADFGDKMNYEGAAKYSCKLVNIIMKKLKNNKGLFNVNVPSASMEDIKGIKFTHLGIRKYEDNYVKRQDPMGRNYYWLSGRLVKTENKEESDIGAIEKNFISITPLHYDLTDYDFLKKLNNTK